MDEKKKARISILIVLLVTAVCFMSLESADAFVSGDCSTCHDVRADGTVDAIPKYDCYRCHSDESIVLQAPKISGTMASMTAGGTFNPAVANNGTKLHNVLEVGGQPIEMHLMSVVPGKPKGQTFGPVGASDLTCAGATGCHGDHTKAGSEAGISGFHHGTHPLAQGAYRYLLSWNGSVQTPIRGKGAADWEKGGASGSNHNIYYESSSSADRATMSAFCATCHDIFHSSVTRGFPGLFIRHPADGALPQRWKTTGSAGVTVNYNANPFGFGGSDYNAVSVTAAYSMNNNPVVGCISCHRAHGSNQPDLLRFDYSTQIARSGETSGCLGCHAAQR